MPLLYHSVLSCKGCWSGCEVCCPDSFYLCIAQVVRAGAATSPPLKLGTDDRWLRDREWQIEAFEEWRSSQAEERDRHAAPQPPLIQTGPTTVQRKLSRTV